MSEDSYLIESIEHTHGDFKVWWGPNRVGYVSDIYAAGRYSKAAAEEICRNAGPENEQMWTETEVLNGAAGPTTVMVRAPYRGRL